MIGRFFTSWATREACTGWLNQQKFFSQFWRLDVQIQGLLSVLSVSCACVFSHQSCPTLCHPMHCSPPGSSVHGTFQGRILEWVVISCSRGSSQPRNQTHISWISCTGSWILYHCATWEAHLCSTLLLKVEQHQLHWMRVHLNGLI